MAVLRRHRRVLALLSVIILVTFLQRRAGADGDADGDGIDDALEAQLAEQFFPTLHYSWGEMCASPDPIRVLFRVHNLVYNGVPNTDRIAIDYVILYSEDCGAEGHSGDNEAFQVLVVKNGDNWYFSNIAAVAHQDTANETSSLGWSDVLWVSENKHGNYASLSSCGDGVWNFDDCEENGPGRSHILYNVGEPDAHLLNNLGDINSNWDGEHVWDDGQFLDAGYIRNQLFIASFPLDSVPPESQQCYSACDDDYDYCFANNQANPDQCEWARYYCYNNCQNAYQWDLWS
jgi:hypothetical protein